MTALHDAATGNRLGSSVTFTEIMTSGDPDSEPVSWLGPTPQFRIDPSANVKNNSLLTSRLSASGDLSSTFGTVPLSALAWSGTGIDVNSTWQATNSRSYPLNQPWSTSPLGLGFSRARKNSTHYFNTQLALRNSWLYPWGSYATTLTYQAEEDGPWARSTLVAALSIPARVSLVLPTTTYSLTADPAGSVAGTPLIAGTLKSNARPSEATILKLRATPLTNGIDTVPIDGLTVRVDTGSPLPLATTDQTVMSFSGPSANKTFEHVFAFKGNWGYPAGTYATTLTYTAENSSGAAPPVALAATTLQVTIPPQLSLSIDSGSVLLESDPSALSSTLPSAARVTVHSNYGQSTLNVSASPPTAGLVTLPSESLRYRTSGLRPTGGNRVVAQISQPDGFADWKAFSQSGQALANLSGRTDGATLTFDYQVLNNWEYPPGEYASTVTYTIIGI